MAAPEFRSKSPIELDVALLVLRVVIGLSLLILNGYGKMTGGPELWTRLGGSMQHLGISFSPVFWGFMAAFSESAGSAFLVIGRFFRPAAALLAFTMVVAVLTHLNMPPESERSGWKGASHALQLFGVYAALFLSGPGRYVLSFSRTRP
jgi:putative oxidoreductase